MNVKLIDFEWNENYSIFASKQYLQSVSNQYGWLGGFVSGKLQFVLPYVIKEKLIFRFLEFQSSTIYLTDSTELKDEKLFLNKAIEFFKSENIDFIKQPSTSVVFSVVPDDSVWTPFGSYIIDLSLSEETLWANIHSKHRNVIRRAEKDQICIVRDRKNAMMAYKLLKQTMDRSNMGFYNIDDYQRIINDLGKNVEVFIAFKNDEPQGCAVFLYSSHSAYYLLGGSSDNPSLGAMNLLHWEAMKYFKSMGVGLYDFVGARIKPEKGSKLEGIQRFKGRFGATMKTGYLWKKALKSWKYNLYNFMSNLKNGKKMVDIIDQESSKF